MGCLSGLLRTINVSPLHFLGFNSYLVCCCSIYSRFVFFFAPCFITVATGDWSELSSINSQCSTYDLYPLLQFDHFGTPWIELFSHFCSRFTNWACCMEASASLLTPYFCGPLGFSVCVLSSARPTTYLLPSCSGSFTGLVPNHSPRNISSDEWLWEH